MIEVTSELTEIINDFLWSDFNELLRGAQSSKREKIITFLIIWTKHT